VFIFFCVRTRNNQQLHIRQQRTNSMGQSPHWEPKRRSVCEDIRCLLWNPNVHYRVHKSSPQFPILSLLNPVHTLHPNVHNIHPDILASTNLKLLTMKFSPGTSHFLLLWTRRLYREKTLRTIKRRKTERKLREKQGQDEKVSENKKIVEKSLYSPSSIRLTLSTLHWKRFRVLLRTAMKSIRPVKQVSTNSTIRVWVPSTRTTVFLKIHLCSTAQGYSLP
jgi:hypothetical protein